MEGGAAYFVSDGLPLSSFSSDSSVSHEIAATGGTKHANGDSKSEEKERLEKREKEITDILKDIFQLGNYYFVFQGVVFTAIFNSPSTLKCQYRWLPISLSLIAGLLNFAILIHLVFKHDRLTYELELDLTGVGDNPIPQYLKDRRDRRRIISIICLLMFVLFVAILLYGSWKILCDQDYLSGNYNIKNCFELCNNYGRCTLFCLTPKS